MPPLRPLFAMWSVAGLLACDPAPPAAAATADGEAVLLLAIPGSRAVDQAITAITLRNAAANGSGPVLGIELRPVRSEAEVTALVRSLLPQMKRYRAIFTPSQTFARAVQRLVPDRPIVFDGVDDPVANCLVDSLRRPGRNATGYMHLLPDTEMKMTELLRDGFPALRRVVVLVSGWNDVPPHCDAAPAAQAACRSGFRAVDDGLLRLIEADRIEAFARALGLSVRFLVLCEAADFRLLDDAGGAAADAGYVVPWHSLFDEHVGELVAAAARTRRPAVYPNGRFTQAGGVLSIEPILDRGRDRASVLALMQVIDGRPPATLPVQTPRGFEIVFNATAAAQQGLSPSRLLLRRADRTLAP